MVACKTGGNINITKRKKKFCLEEKANKAREEEEKSKRARANNPLQPTTTQQRDTINRIKMNHEEFVAHARRNQKEQKRSRVTRQTKQQPKTKPAMRPTSPGTNTRPQWLKNARNRIMKKTLPKDFNAKSKEAAIQHSKEISETKQEKARKLLYSSSWENKGIT